MIRRLVLNLAFRMMSATKLALICNLILHFFLCPTMRTMEVTHKLVREAIVFIGTHGCDAFIAEDAFTCRSISTQTVHEMS